ncbi:peptidoglycan-binding domain-containing protein, partial [Lentilactobacillus parabuchneri]|nr:peptidoglycan-binding protein [Lentilactobacillus parabuchneri]
MADEAVLAVQNWLNKTYTGIPGFEPAPTDGHTGWTTIYALREALQHELGIGTIGEGFGTTTRSALSGVVDQLKPGYKGNMAQLIQGAFWCKGINPGSELNQDFSVETVQSFKLLQQDAGLPADGVVTVNLMAALFDMSAFVLVSGGDKNVRQLQQWLNAEYSAYLGIMPCDGIYQRDTNIGLIYALQRAVGISADVANGNFGDATNAALKGVQLSVGSTGLLVKIVKYGLYLNSMYGGDFSESFGSDVATSIIRFRKFMKYPNETSGTADYTVIKG